MSSGNRKKKGGEKGKEGEEKKRNATFADQSALQKQVQELQEQAAKDRAERAKAEAQAAKAEADRENERLARLAAEEQAAKDRARADNEQAGRLAAEERATQAEVGRIAAEGQIAEALNKPVRECIRGAPFTTQAFRPKWGDEIRRGESTHSTKFSTAWLEITKEDVDRWPNEDLVAFLEEAELKTVDRDGEQQKLLDIILDEGKADISLQKLLNGTAAGENSMRSSVRAKGEDVVEFKLAKYCWTPLEEIMGGGNNDSQRYPIVDFIETIVRYGSERDSMQSLVPMPPHYIRYYKHDKCIEMTPVGVDRVPLPHTEENVVDEDVLLRQREYANKCARVMVKIKPDVLCPKAKKRGQTEEDQEANAAYNGDLLNYMKSEKYFDADFNPVAQVVTYAVASRTKCAMIHTLNHITFCKIAAIDETTGKPLTLLSEKMDCSSTEPFLPSRPEWSRWEILIRFILASEGSWYLEKFPDALKILFKEQHEKKREEKKRTLDDMQQQSSSAGTSSNVGSSSSRGRRGSAKDAMEHEFVLQRFCYADLWAPLRFAVPATHSIEEECSLERLDGDAELIGEGRMGPVYRQSLQGYDVAVKLLVFCCKRELDGVGDVYPFELRDEMAHEAKVYTRLRSLQGKTIPDLLWYGELVQGMADALATKYSGQCLPDYPSDAQIASAIKALDSLHENDVLHGDIALRNFVCVGDKVKILDFGFSQFHEYYDDDEAKWQHKLDEEKQTLRKLLGKQLNVIKSRKHRHGK